MAKIDIRIAGPSEYLSVVDFVNTNFVPREPTCEAQGLCPDEGYRMPFFDSWCMARIKREGSLVVVAETGEKELVGVGFACHMKPGEEEVEDEPVTEKTQRTHRVPEKFQRIMNFLGWFEEKGVAKDVSSSPPDENGRLDYTIITTRAEGPRIPGVGTAMVKKMVEIGRQRGIKHQTVLATSVFSAKVFQNNGFKVCATCPYEDYKVDGKVVFRTESPHTHATYLSLRD